MNKIKECLKNNYKFLIVLIFLILIFCIKFPYYIDAPGGISDISNKITIEGYESSGSFNLAYVKEYRATIPTLLISLFNKDWNVYKQEEMILDNEDAKTYFMRDRILLDESISDAIFVAYNKASKSIEIKENKLYVAYISDEADTNLKVGDKIVKINEIDVESKSEISDILNKLKVGDKISITVVNNDVISEKEAYIDNDKKIGIILCEVNEYDTNPKIEVKTDSNESGSSGGLITALSIYNSLIKEDITKGLKIVGTGTIDKEGNVGSIGGVEYKLKSAVKNHADLFIVPKDENYMDAIKLKEKNGYKIKIIGVETFDEVINYLNKIDE